MKKNRQKELDPEGSAGSQINLPCKMVTFTVARERNYNKYKKEDDYMIHKSKNKIKTYCNQ